MNFEKLFLKQNEKKEKKELPPFKEYAINFDTLEPLKNGDNLVELNGNEAKLKGIFTAYTPTAMEITWMNISERYIRKA